MVKVRKFENFNKNGEYKVKGIDGFIEKIIVFCETPIHDAQIKIITPAEEVLSDDLLRGKITIFYPRNLIFISQEQKEVEKYCVANKLIFEVSGMSEADKINYILVYYS